MTKVRLSEGKYLLTFIEITDNPLDRIQTGPLLRMFKNLLNCDLDMKVWGWLKNIMTELGANETYYRGYRLLTNLKVKEEYQQLLEHKQRKSPNKEELSARKNI